jgi:hypothetical protein
MFFYGFRYYDAVTGRWPSRDPIKETAFRTFLFPNQVKQFFSWKLLVLNAEVINLTNAMRLELHDSVYSDLVESSPLIVEKKEVIRLINQILDTSFHRSNEGDYLFILNNTINDADYLGLSSWVDNTIDWFLYMIPYLGPRVPDPVTPAPGLIEAAQLVALQRALGNCIIDPPPCDPNCKAAAAALAEAQRQHNERNRK